MLACITGTVDHSGASLNLIVEPGLYMLLRFQKAGVRENYETGNQAFSMRLRFLTIRHGKTVRSSRMRSRRRRADPVRVSLRAHQGNTERLRDLERRQDVPDLLHMIEIMTG
jgi:hypothetical protein